MIKYLNDYLWATGLFVWVIIIFASVACVIASFSAKRQAKKNKEVEDLPSNINTGDPEKEVHRRYVSTKKLKEKIYQAGGSDGIDSRKKGILTLQELEFLHKLVDCTEPVNQFENVEWIDDEVKNDVEDSSKEYGNSD